MSAGPVISRLSTEQSRELSDQWRALRRAATGVAVLTSPALFVWLHKIQELSVGWSLVLTQTGGPKPNCDTDEVGPYNFDTSEAEDGCLAHNQEIPLIKLTINGQTFSYLDTNQTLNTGGTDPGACGYREYTPWTAVPVP